MNTLRQISKNFDRFVAPAIHEAYPSTANSIVNEIISFQTANTREEYLEWLGVWKRTNALVVEAIKRMKKIRACHPLNESDLNRFRKMAHRLYNARVYMKDASYVRKIDAEIAREQEKVFDELVNLGVIVDAA